MTTSTATISKAAVTETPILDVLTERWSPRAYDAAHTLEMSDLLPALEAARWAPSAANTQPARFFVGIRGSSGFDLILAGLMESNAHWAKNAAALVVNATETVDTEGKPRRWAEYDLGQAVAHFSVQAHADGLFVHQMGGIHAEKIARDLELPESLRVVSVMAVGVATDAHAVELADKHLQHELSPRVRNELSSLTRLV